MIRFACPTCGNSLSAPDESAGKIGKCSCGQRVRVPIPPPSQTAVADVPPLLIPSPPAVLPSNLPTVSATSPLPISQTQGRFPRSPWAIVIGLALLAVLLHFMNCTWGTQPKAKGIPILRFREAIADEGAADRVKMFRNLCEEENQRCKELMKAREIERNNLRIDEYSELISFSLGLQDGYVQHLNEERARAEGVQGIWAREGTARDSAMMIGILIPVLLLLGASVLCFSSLSRRPKPPAIPEGS